MAWHHLQYVLGLRLLGHDVCFLEDSDDYPACYDPTRHATGTDPTYGLRFAGEALAWAGLGDRWGYYDAHAGAWRGPCGARVHDLLRGADLLLNLSGVNPLRPWLEAVPRRAFVDTDPVFTQIRSLTDVAFRLHLHGHNVFFTFGENIAQGTAAVPEDGVAWQATRQPVVASAWKAAPARPDGAFTTVMQWDSYAPVVFAGTRYGMKSESFEPFLDLPARVAVPLEVAIGGETAPRGRLVDHGWRIADPLRVALTPWDFRDYVLSSAGEFSVAKHGYVQGDSGWFSERSANYLACGRPVVVQDTGFSRWLPVGRGVLAVRSVEEAAEALRECAGHLEAHGRWARDLACEHFDSGRVLQSLMSRALA